MNYLSEYNPEWPGWFHRIERHLRPHLPDCLPIEHVGSTSIIGMVAKPIIDIDIVVPDGCLPPAIASLARAGYVHQGDLGIPRREAFAPDSDTALALPHHHLYACEESSPELHKHICFRDYLSVHPLEALRLTLFKRRLANELHLSRSEYIEAKAVLVAELTDAAMIWHRDSFGALSLRR